MLAVLIAPRLASAQNGDSAPASNAPWRLLLQQQLKAAKSCDLLEVLTFNEFDLGDYRALEGRASCIDGREFTFSRRRPHQSFEFELCEPTLC
jgi:hypothetical protein